jgi:hypothetical protein
VPASQAENLNSLHEQLSGEKIRKVIKVLEVRRPRPRPPAPAPRLYHRILDLDSDFTSISVCLLNLRATIASQQPL